MKPTTSHPRCAGWGGNARAPRESPGAVLAVRIIKVRPAHCRLDVRQYLKSDGFTGYTRRGICLTGEEFDVLLEQRNRLRAALEGSKAPVGDRALSAESKPSVR